jgi:CO/xanthine dehydrogenase Mo-binding subunit
MGVIEDKTESVFGATLSRRNFVKGTGALIVGLSLPTAFAASSGAAAGATNQVDPSQLASWIEIHPDNTVLIRTGFVEMGNGTAVAYRQIVAEELNVPFEAITKMVLGSTDQTVSGPKMINGGVNSAGDLRKVAAYTYQALLGMASTTLGVPVAGLTVKNGVVSAGGKSVSYGDLVKNQQLSLTIPTTGSMDDGSLAVSGNPPLKPVSEYSIVGKSYPNPFTTDIVSGAAVWVANVRLPGMLHARMVKPKTLGSTLVSVGTLNKKAFPTSQVVVKGNLVGVLSPNEWEAIAAAADVAATTKWSDWQALPGSGNVYKALRATDYSKVTPGPGVNKGSTSAALASAAKVLSATYTTPYIKQAPIGPSIAVADVRKDGTTHVWYHGQSPGITRKVVASILSTPMSNVVVHWLDGSGTYGRSNAGPDGAEADAVILSQAVGRPVRVQWMRPEDMQWAVSTFATLSDVKLGLDTTGNMVGYQGNYYMRGRFDGRGLGALLAGMPPGAVEDGDPTKVQVNGHYSWSYTASTQPAIYDKVPNIAEMAYGAAPFGQVESPYNVGMRIHSMRTPAQREYNFALEGIINEAAAAAGVDPIEYRLRHTTNDRLITVLKTLKAEHGWQTRPSPSPKAKAAGSTPVTGQGMGVMFRSNGFHAFAADITVNPKTGKIKVDRYTIVFEGGIIVNPRRVQRNAENGATQGLSEVLREEMTFDKSQITSTDWVKYPILRMVDLPKIKAVIISRPDLAVFAQGSEGFNAGPYVAVPAALFDATGKVARSLPLRPPNVRAILTA